MLRRRPKTTESEPPPVMPSWLEPADSHGGRKHDAGFLSMPGSRRRLLGGLPRIEFLQSPEGPDSLAAGKNAGNFFDSAVFCENMSRKQLRIQLFADEFPTRTGQGLFLSAQGINSARREWQGISGIMLQLHPLAPTHPIAPKFFLVVDKKILNTGCGRGRIRLASPDRPRPGCACRTPDQIRGRS